jgi:hypothetical protein
MPSFYDPTQPWAAAGYQDSDQWSDAGAREPPLSKIPPFVGPGAPATDGTSSAVASPNGLGPDGSLIQASFALPAPAGAGPFVLPPYAIPGSRENQIWTDHATRSLRGLLDLILKNSKNDACYDRYEEEIRRCEQSRWQVAHPDYTHGCKERARDRYNLCIRNGGTPNPDEPPEWTPGPDKDEETWRNFGR